MSRSLPALLECHTQGETLEEAVQNMKETISLCLESLMERGAPIQEGLSFQGGVPVLVAVMA
jgi:predicted RNase H-like HicB family nuclease